MGSLRTQITVSATVLVVLAITLSGLVIAVRIDHQNRAQVDDQLRARAGKVREDEAKDRGAGKALLGENGGPAKDSALLAGTDTITRVLAGQRVVAQRGEASLKDTMSTRGPGCRRSPSTATRGGPMSSRRRRRPPDGCRSCSRCTPSSSAWRPTPA